MQFGAVEESPVPEEQAPAAPAQAAIAPKAPDEVVRVTPMMEQYIEIKAANPDCLLFYRMGDFYELFFDDAEIASRALGIMLTKRGKHLGRDIPMCGVPIERADEYLHRLIALGHRVAVCEQLEDPAEARKRGAKSVVRRDVVRLVTPGTLTEDSLLDAKRNNYLLALARSRASAGRRPFRAGLDRHIDRRISRRRMRPRFARGRDRAHRAGRDHRLRRALCRHRARALSAFAAGAHPAHPRRVRRRDGGAAAGRRSSAWRRPPHSARFPVSSLPPPRPLSLTSSAPRSANVRRCRSRRARRPVRRSPSTRRRAAISNSSARFPASGAARSLPRSIAR